MKQILYQRELIISFSQKSHQQMKSFILTFFLLFILTPCSMNAQKRSIEYSLKPCAGINVSSLARSKNAKTIVGLAAGADFYVHQKGSPFVFSLGAIYSQEGAKASQEVPFYERPYGRERTPRKVNRKIDYLQVPLMLHSAPWYGFSAGTGILLELRVHDDYESDDGVLIVKGSTEPFVVALPLALSYEYKNVSLDFRYILGLTNVSKAVGSDEKQSTFQFTLGYKFHL